MCYNGSGGLKQKLHSHTHKCKRVEAIDLNPHTYIYSHIRIYIHLFPTINHTHLNEILCLLNGSGIFGKLGGLEFDGARGRVEADLQLQILHDRRHEVVPLLPQRSQAVRRTAHLAILYRPALYVQTYIYLRSWTHRNTRVVCFT